MFAKGKKNEKSRRWKGRKAGEERKEGMVVAGYLQHSSSLDSSSELRLEIS